MRFSIRPYNLPGCPGATQWSIKDAKSRPATFPEAQAATLSVANLSKNQSLELALT